MRTEDNYWVRRATGAGLSRRRFIGSAATLATGAASLAVVGCGDDDEPSGGASTTGASPTAAASPTPTAPQVQKGGTAHFTSANNTWDSFDIDRSRFSPVAWLFGLTNLGIVQWKSFSKAELEGGMAEKWEQPDKQTAVFKLRPNVYWHNKPPVNGRLATAEDIAFFLKRNKEGKDFAGADDINFYRKSSYQTIDSVSVTDANTVTVKFKTPEPFILNTLAGSYAKVQAQEALRQFEKQYANLNADLVIGTGPFVLKEFAAEGKSSWVRHDKFYSQVNWDGINWLPLFTDQTAQQAAFEQRQIDAMSPSNPAVIKDLLDRFKGRIYETKSFGGNPMAGTYYGGAAPWKDPRLIGAIFKTVDRRALIQSGLKGLGALSGNVPPPQAAFGIAERELITFEGYREDRAKEEAEAKQMWEAGGGPSLGKITVDIPDIWEGLYSGISALMMTQFKKVLGNEFEAKIEPYSTITNKIINLAYGNGKPNIWYGWITEIFDLEPTQLNYTLFNSTQPQFQAYAVKSDKIDELTAKSVVEFDIEKRKELGKDINRELLKNWGAGIPYNMVNLGSTLRWNYLKVPETVPFVQQHQYGTQYYFDQTDPTWQGRPA